MDFKTNKIRKTKADHKKPEIFEKKMSKNKLTFPIIASFIIIVILTAGVVKAISAISLSFVLEVAGDSLETDGYGHTNFLLLGTGGKNHEGGDLTDTIMVASLDKSKNQVSIISIPRDLYVKDELLGNTRVNEVFLNAKIEFESSAEGLEYAKNKIEDIIGIPIHYWLRADFKGFTELVDAIGGVDVTVENSIYDPYYPKDGTFEYEPFTITKGLHHLNGETALKYARSRKTTSDFDRAERQQQIIYAIKEKAFSTNVIFSKSKITNILDTLQENIETNITIKEILTLGSIAKNLNSEDISHLLIHDDPTQCGGFLYTPLRELYHGMFILIQAGEFNYIHRYADLHLNTPNTSREDLKIQILNGTKQGGTAGETKQILKRFCFEIPRYGNARNQLIEQTTYYYKQKFDTEGNKIDSRPLSIDFLQKLIPGVESTEIPQEYKELGYDTEVGLIIELGSDYIESKNYLEDPFYYLPDAEGFGVKTTETDED